MPVKRIPPVVRIENNIIKDKDPMNDVTDKVKGEDTGSKELLSASEKIVINDAPMVGVQQTKHESLENPKDDDDDNKEKDADPSTEDDEILNTVRLLGDPLTSQGPYTFYSALAYRKHIDVTKKKKQRWKNQKLESCDSSSSCCCSDDAGNYFCNCDDGSSKCSLSTSCSEWSVVHMNHFYAVRPWYSKRNSSTSVKQQQLKRRRCHRKNSPKLATSTSAERRQHHYQQSVCIGELELLWRDDSVARTTMVSSSSSSLLKKRNSNKGVLPSQTAVSNGRCEGTDSITNINSHGDTAVSSDDDDGGGNDDSSSLLPRRRTLPRRTRQPSAKKLEAAESYAAAAAAAEETSDNPSQQSPHRSRFSTSVLTDPDSVGVPLSSPNAQYRNGNLLCSVRLYVMPDQTATGRLGGVHGEDEVLEINTWGASCDGDRWPSNTYLNGGNSVGSIYNGGGGVDDYGYGSGSHSSGTLPSGCSGLVLRAEDFVEWVRGGLVNDDEYESTESDSESLESECDNSSNDRELIKIKSPKKEEEQQSKHMSSTTDIDKIEQWQEQKLDMRHDDEKNKVKTDNSLIEDVVKKENLMTVNMDKLKIEQVETIGVDLDETNNKEIIKEKLDDDNNMHYSKSAIDEVLETERIPLAAARIHPRQGANHRHRNHCHRQHRHLNSESLVNGEGSSKITMKHNLHNEIITGANKADNDHTKNQKCNCKRRRRSYQSNNEKTKFYNNGSSYKQRLVVMSYSRYCRYRAQLQRRREEQLKTIDGDNETTEAFKTRGVDTMNTTRVLFCRDTYDYPAELLLEPFNAQHGQQQNTTVLVNHMAPKLKGWPAHPASWMSFRWNRVRRRLRHLERGNGSNEDRRRRRRRKLKKKQQRQNGAAGGAMIMNFSSSTDDDDSDDSDSDEASSATNDAATNSTTTASDSDGAPPVSSATSKTSNKNLSASTTKVNDGVHQNNKKPLSAPAACNMIIINGATERTGTVNKRMAGAVGQLGQQPTKRSRIVYSIGGQPQNQQIQQQRRVVFQQQHQQHTKPRQLQQQQQFNQRSRQTEQFNQFTQAQHNNLVQQQQQKLQSLNRRLPTPISSIQSATTRIIHHHLPPSVTIMPVVVPSSSTAAHEQQQRNNHLPNKQKQYSPATIISTTPQRQNNNSNRQSNSLPPVIFKYEDGDNQEYESNDKSRYTNTSVAAALAVGQRHIERHNFEDEQKQQREEEERQRRWLVNALRLGGLEVTAVPVKVNSSGGNSSDDKDISTMTTVTSQQQREQRHFRQRSVSFQSLPIDNDHNNSGVVRNEHHDGDDDSNLDSDSDSVIMTVTPDVISLLNKSQQQIQESPEDNFSSTSSGTIAHSLQHQRQLIKTNNDNSNSGYKQHPVTIATEAAAALHDKINRAIDSLKQQEQQKLNTAVPVSSNSKNRLIIDGSNHQQSNHNNNRQHQRIIQNTGVIGFRQQQTLPIIDCSAKQLVIPNTSITATPKQQKHLSKSTMNSNQHQQNRKSHLPLSSISMVGPSTANLEITLVPTTSSNTNSTKLLLHQQQKRNSSLAAPNNSLGGPEILPVAYSSSSMSVKQLLRRNASGISTNTSSLSIIDTQSNNKNRQHLQHNSGNCMPITANSSSQQQQLQQQQIQQLLMMATSSVVTPQNQQQPQTDKRKPQQNKD